MLVLRVTFTSQEMQRVAGLSSDDIVINTKPTRNIMETGSAPPQPRPQPSVFSGSGGGGFVGNDGRLYRHSCKAPPESFGVLPNMALTTINAAVHHPHVQNGLYAEPVRRNKRIRSRSEREKMEIDAAAIQKLIDVEDASDDEKEAEKSMQQSLLDDYSL